jgi:hypothetical protein
MNGGSEMTKRIYIAAPWHHRTTARVVRDAFAAAGYGCTSRWLDFVGDSSDPAGLAQEAAHDYDDVFEADTLILLNLPGGHGGKDVETGLALAWNIPVILIGRATNVFHHHHLVRVVPDVTAALAALEAE